MKIENFKTHQNILNAITKNRNHKVRKMFNNMLDGEPLKLIIYGSPIVTTDTIAYYYTTDSNIVQYISIGEYELMRNDKVKDFSSN